MNPELSPKSHLGARFDGDDAVTNATYSGRLNGVLAAWNLIDFAAAVHEVLPCCGSNAWACALAKARPFRSVAALQKASDEIWRRLTTSDWEEAFASHPRIGEKKSASSATAQSATWSKEEQNAVAKSGTDMLERLAQANALYEQRFGRIYIVCATGKSAEQMLALLEERLQNSGEQELVEAAEQQRQITQIRLKKWLQL